ncbi:MAG: ribonuclease H-like domain-containing protein [Leptospiraceae bacterium]|nr:ribonuclease H-like domain-containing protein [Leptospiraceae bacterium]
MLRHTFQHITGIDKFMEANLWKSGISSWDKLRLNPSILKELGDERFFPDEVLWELDHSENALVKQDSHFFWNKLPYEEAWRLYDDLPQTFYALDIETTGLDLPHKVTCVCVYDSKEIYQFTRSKNLDDFHDFWIGRNSPIILSYNGFKFDIPFLARSMQWKNPFPHLDLMHVLHKMGIKGGLKGSEVKLGIIRESALSGIDGFQAVRLWNQYVETDISEYLDLLVKYNQEDTINLHRILRIVYDTKKFELGILFSS